MHPASNISNETGIPERKIIQALMQLPPPEAEIYYSNPMEADYTHVYRGLYLKQIELATDPREVWPLSAESGGIARRYTAEPAQKKWRELLDQWWGRAETFEQCKEVYDRAEADAELSFKVLEKMWELATSFDEILQVWRYAEAPSSRKGLDNRFYPELANTAYDVIKDIIGQQADDCEDVASIRALYTSFAERFKKEGIEHDARLIKHVRRCWIDLLATFEEVEEYKQCVSPHDPFDEWAMVFDKFLEFADTREKLMRLYAITPSWTQYESRLLRKIVEQFLKVEGLE